nr:immunoglobulin light chain junction region [Macaca mulatta]
CMQALDFPPTF